MKGFFEGDWFMEKRDKRWLKLMAPMALGFWGLLAAISCLGLGIGINRTDAVIWAFIAMIAAAALGGFGYANLKAAFGFTGMGILAGLGLMAYVFARPVEHRGIVGLVSGVELTCVFFIIGINVEMLGYLMRGRRRYGR